MSDLKIHVGESRNAMGARFTDALKVNRDIVGRRVRDNLLKKHIEPLFC
jgi:hypothetical protein